MSAFTITKFVALSFFNFLTIHKNDKLNFSAVTKSFPSLTGQCYPPARLANVKPNGRA